MKAGVSIRTKMLAVTVLLLGALVAVAALVLVEVIGPSFQTLERQMARSTVEIIRNTVRRDFAALNVLVKDWSYWDDTYRYVVGQQDDFASANLIEETLAGASLNLLLIEDIAGQVIWGKTYNLEEEEFFELADFAEGSELLARLKELALSSENGLRGLVGTSAGPMMIAAHPILTSAETGPPRGVLMMGRLLNDAILADVGDTLDLIVQASPVQASDTHATTDESGPCGAEIRIQEAGADSLRACITLKDVFGQPLVVLSTSIDRTVAAIGRTAQATGLGITGVAGLILILVFLFSQQVLVLGPLRRLTSSVEQVGLQAEPDTPLPETRKDEFGILAQSFNRMLERVARLTNFDAVTGLPNRRLFHDRANQVLRIARRAGGKAAVLFIDLDDFKAINDTRGHSVGDALLRVIGEELSDLMRETDTVARFGGDEFVIVIHPVDVRSRINELSERIQLRFQQPFRVSGTTLFTNASIGVAVFPDDAEAVETLISLADAAMYQAKGDGGRQIAFIDTDAYVADGHLRSLELSFREALSADQLHLVFQSQVDLRSEEVVGHEALVRWRHPEQGVLAAGRFIHLAESAANFARFDAWVLRAACSALASGQTHGGAKLKHISVNICARHVQSPALVELVKDTLQETGVKPDQLTLEITETVMVTRPEAAIEVLSALRGIGVRVAIDDFGTGYASLAALHRFPIDELKIDRSFVAGLPDDRAALAIAQATLTLARTFALDVVAEGVETAQQRDTLIEAGCTIGQGFLWSPLS